MVTIVRPGPLSPPIIAPPSLPGIRPVKLGLDCIEVGGNSNAAHAVSPQRHRVEFKYRLEISPPKTARSHEVTGEHSNEYEIRHVVTPPLPLWERGPGGEGHAGMAQYRKSLVGATLGSPAYLGVLGGKLIFLPFVPIVTIQHPRPHAQFGVGATL